MNHLIRSSALLSAALFIISLVSLLCQRNSFAIFNWSVNLVLSLLDWSTRIFKWFSILFPEAETKNFKKISQNETITWLYLNVKKFARPFPIFFQNFCFTQDFKSVCFDGYLNLKTLRKMLLKINIRTKNSKLFRLFRWNNYVSSFSRSQKNKTNVAAFSVSVRKTPKMCKFVFKFHHWCRNDDGVVDCFL